MATQKSLQALNSENEPNLFFCAIKNKSFNMKYILEVTFTLANWFETFPKDYDNM